MSTDERLSAWLDDELEPREAADLGRDLEADPALAAELEDLGRVRAILRSAGPVEPRVGALDRIVVAVARADGEEAAVEARAPVVSLARRRRIPTLASVAASIAIIGAVVGGVGGTTTLPAVGDLVARHDAAAAEAMPDDVQPMPMDDMAGVGPSMPAELAMTGAFHDDTGLVHLVYRDEVGSVVSVFRREGDTDVRELPDGEVADMAGTDVWSGVVDDLHVAVVDGDGYVWTVVGVDDHDTMVAIMDDLPSRTPGFVDRLADVADVVVRPWRLG